MRFYSLWRQKSYADKMTFSFRDFEDKKVFKLLLQKSIFQQKYFCCKYRKKFQKYLYAKKKQFYLFFKRKKLFKTFDGKNNICTFLQRLQ